jgi:hypothetical protein
LGALLLYLDNALVRAFVGAGAAIFALGSVDHANIAFFADSIARAGILAGAATYAISFVNLISHNLSPSLCVENIRTTFPKKIKGNIAGFFTFFLFYAAS